MSKLDDLKPNAAVRGVLPDALVTVVSAQWFGSEALELTYKTPAGKVANELLYRHDEPRIEVVTQGRPWSFDGDPIPGLYGAREMGSIYGMLYPGGGGNLAECIALGRAAGEDAAHARPA